MLLDIHLGHNKEYTLTYEMFDNRVAKIIWGNYDPLVQDYDFVSRTQFYNWGESEQDVREKLDESIENIKRLKPEIFVGGDDLNRLHENFPDHVHKETGELRQWLSMFNYHLHHLEDITRTKNRRFLVATTHGGPEPQPLEGTDFELFTPTRLENHLYMNYPHVGKHIMEIYFDNDIYVPKDHIVPTSIIKSDLLAWFAQDRCIEADQFVKRVRRWCMQISHKLPYAPDDARLAIGYIPIGKLTHDPDINMISQNKFVHSIEAR